MNPTLYIATRHPGSSPSHDEAVDRWETLPIKTHDSLARNLFICMLQLDRWEHGCNISSVVGGLAGIGGGTAVIGGVILMPPLAIAGINTFLISGVGIGAVSVAGGGVRLLLRESVGGNVDLLFLHFRSNLFPNSRVYCCQASVQSAIAKGTVHAAMGISIAIDVLTVLLSVKVRRFTSIFMQYFPHSL
ncbi:unnamed protein product [Angiostrongylus costaricensis]|uniref:AA_permease domain-containing protein n=1 Tax=Angiostrongylus costaricensis TaxID=334426 RepID=A0A0R3PTE0_ANGCS|nr:unnamed protein product [Angiostrongylus costaricensis]